MSNESNPTPFILDALTRKAMETEYPNETFDDEKANRAMGAAQEIMDVFERRGIDPVEGYVITGALSDAIYLHLMSLAGKK